ncbi:Asp-tRNA(Asn)/Glu-tRNA(Gln) amidotransferase subunit GatA, partial [bacterium]|nr:Asp-tRNA(Asn)/Glu-tRNA(Gln) amidotransferase subunit GatA [bacterium]
AAGIDDARARGERLGPLAGIPVAVKDNISTRGLGTTCASKMLAAYEPPFDATVISRLLAAGAVIVGKTNMDEFAMGSSNEHSAFGIVRNPWGLSRVPGGSSGGSAAALAAGEAVLALGSDTGGSVRQPAGFCGVVGMKPSYGRVSRYGLVAFASSFDQIGPMARDVEGAAALFDVIAGVDEMDATSVDDPVADCRTAARSDVTGLTVGVVADCFTEGTDPAVAGAVKNTIEALENVGVSVREVSLPRLSYGAAAYYLVADAEASANLARYDGVKFGHRSGDRRDLDSMYAATRAEGFGAEVRRRIMLGTYALSAGYYDRYYATAQRARALIADDVRKALAGVDAIVGPVSPTTAFGLGEHVDDPLSMYLSDIFTVPANLAGVAAISVPCGLSPDGLPIGFQITVDRHSEPTAFALAGAVERAVGGPFAPPIPDEEGGA